MGVLVRRTSPREPVTRPVEAAEYPLRARADAASGYDFVRMSEEVVTERTPPTISDT